VIFCLYVVFVISVKWRQIIILVLLQVLRNIGTYLFYERLAEDFVTADITADTWRVRLINATSALSAESPAGAGWRVPVVSWALWYS